MSFSSRLCSYCGSWPGYDDVLTGVFGRSGGVSIVGGGGKIDINNTLDERLKLLETDALPMVRTTLFGKNESRKFYD